MKSAVEKKWGKRASKKHSAESLAPENWAKKEGHQPNGTPNDAGNCQINEDGVGYQARCNSDIQQLLLPVYTDTDVKGHFTSLCQKLGVKLGDNWQGEFGAELREWAKGTLPRPIRTLSLFSGAGGLDIGFHDAGFEITEQVEIEEKFVATLRANSGPGKYSQLYKAASRGAKAEWLAIVDMAEFGKLEPLAALKQLVVMLFNRSDQFKKDTEFALQAVRAAARKLENLDQAIKFIRDYVDSSTYAARLFEISMHSLFQVLEDHGAFGGDFLKKLSQMRSANKKHGNIGDIEITLGTRNSLQIIESWDAKYGKPYLREELEELHEKLQEHPETKHAGFVVDANPNLKSEIKNRIEELEQFHDLRIRILEFNDWISMQAQRISIPKKEIAQLWLVAFAESLCQRRRDRAPIDEPADSWVRQLGFFAENWMKNLGS